MKDLSIDEMVGPAALAVVRPSQVYMFLYSVLSVTSYLLHGCTLPDIHCLAHGMCLYQIIMTLHFLNDVANDAQKSKITS